MRVSLFLLPVLSVLLGFIGSASAYKVTKRCPDACGGPATIRCENIQDSGCNGTTCVCVDLIVLPPEEEPIDP